MTHIPSFRMKRWDFSYMPEYRAQSSDGCWQTVATTLAGVVAQGDKRYGDRREERVWPSGDDAENSTGGRKLAASQQGHQQMSRHKNPPPESQAWHDKRETIVFPEEHFPVRPSFRIVSSRNDDPRDSLWAYYPVPFGMLSSTYPKIDNIRRKM